MPRYAGPAAPQLVAPQDEFDMYGIELPLGDWSYRVDQPGTVYGAGPYPFHEPLQRTEWHPASPLIPFQVDTGTTRPTAVRVSPDVEFRSWRNEYVSLRPAGDVVHAQLKLFVARQGMGATTRRVTLAIDPGAGTVTVPDACPARLRDQAEVKGRRLLALLLEARSERDAGQDGPRLTLHPGLRNDDPEMP
ncbi:hypothetical protein ACFVH7_27215 [Kitasatospora indigofera]|uniref:hypothetical protein n=1 Tax=Kitasatospora indigofera TaxID=67307 RepID=UPI003628165F